MSQSGLQHRLQPGAASAHPRHALLARTVALALLGMCTLPSGAMAHSVAGTQQQAEATRSYSIPAGSLTAALQRLGREAGIILAFSTELTAGVQSQGLNGSYAVAGALHALLAGTGLQALRQNNGGYLIQRLPAAAASSTSAAAAPEAVLPAVTVTAEGGLLEELAATYAGGQVARGGRLGVLGNASMLDAPFSQVSYTAQLAEDQQARTIGDVVSNDPSVRVIVPPGFPYENMMIRGFAIDSADVSLNGLYGVLPPQQIPVEMYERIEVLKGPNALVNGISPTGSVGGGINVVPKRAADAPLTRLGLSYESDAQFGLRADIGRRFGTNNAWGVRVNGLHSNGDSSLDGRSQREQMASVALDYRGEKLSLSLDVFHTSQDMRGGSGLFARFAGDMLTAPDAKTNLLPGAYSRFRDNGLVLRGEYEISDNAATYASLGRRQNRRSGHLGFGPVADAGGNFTDAARSVSGYENTVSADAGLRGKFATGTVKHQWTFGVARLYSEGGTAVGFGDEFSSNIYAPGPALIPDAPARPPRDTASTLSSVVLADTLSMLDQRLRLTIGARSQRVQTDNYSYDEAGQRSTQDRYDEKAVTPMAGLVFKPLPQLALYANYIEGLSKGDTVTDETAANYRAVFAPYKTRQYEVGGKWDLGQITQTLSFYQITQPTLLRNPATSIYKDDGRQRNRGVEWNTFGQLQPGMRLLGGLAYTQAKLLKTEDGLYDGHTAFGVPRWRFVLGGEWDSHWLPGLTLNARLERTGRLFLSEENRLTLPAWQRWDIGARYESRIGGKRTVVRAGVQNVFNKNYWGSAYFSGMAALGAPRTVNLSVTTDF
ncbi:TonB-dependent receptor [Massilia sp. MB5]|uniref:TonB-dependent receptor n=1 Tax=Massilia sp. MB5 TaxID=2919578 RepID=UPI001F0F02D3|nr:TonB-dependent receptor [Massilia sp. MB5]UMR31561.1 TonB-dependent receptor [Massilia sp. MB5]